MKKKTKPKLKLKRKSPAKPARRRVTKVLHTKFMDAFAARFKDWPVSGAAQTQADQFTEFARVLYGSVAKGSKASDIPPPAGDDELQKFHQELVSFLDGYKGGWPMTPAAIPFKNKKKYGKGIAHETVRLWEVAVVLQGLLGQSARKMQCEDGVVFWGWPPIIF